MRRALLVIGTLALLTAIWVAFSLYAWIAPPDEELAVIERRWAEVEALARPDERSGRPRAALDEALHAFDESDPAAMISEDLNTVSRIELDALTTSNRAALEALLRWHDEGGGLGAERCINAPLGPTSVPPVEPFKVFPAINLARLALRVSVASDDAPAVAAMQLGALLRARGTAIHGAVGFAIAASTRDWAHRRGYDPSTLLALNRPSAMEIISIFAREAVCTYEQATVLRADHEGLGTIADRPALSGVFDVERELLMVRWVLGRDVTRIAEAASRAPPDAVLSAIERALPDERDAGDLPKSLVVRVVASSALASVAANMIEGVREYERFLAEAPTPLDE
jgi:hypothetical protein